jgi:tripartite-type tricarboxylate transporter receptor subunit TctC
VRNAAAPEIPTVAEAGLPGFESTQWYALLAPANTPKDIVNRLHGEMVKILQQPEIRQRFAGDGAEPVGNTPDQFAAYIKTELAKWAKVARAAGIEPQ